MCVALNKVDKQASSLAILPLEYRILVNGNN
jgi:hypothetical protein